MASLPDALSIRFLGTSACTPAKGGNTASFVINRRLAIDTGWYLTDRLLAADIDPLAVEAVVLTHCHHDHILGLPQLLFYYGIQRDRRPERPLRVYGPAGEVERVVDDALRFLQLDRYRELEFGLEVHGLAAGDAFALGGLRVTTCAALHAVPGLCLRVANAAGASAAFSGDTRYNHDLIELARGAGLLAHEASHGARAMGDDVRWGHSGAPDAATVAREAAVGCLALVHLRQDQRRAALAAAQAIFPKAFVPDEGQGVLVPSHGSRP